MVECGWGEDMFKLLKKYLGSKLIWVKCGGFKCNEVFQVRDEDAKPDIYICKGCQEKIDAGIISFIHANTGKLNGNFHLIDGYEK